MPNWAFTSVKCTGNTEEIQDLYDRMKRLQEMKEPLKPNGFGTTWLGNLVEDLGVDFKDMAEAMILVRENNDKDDGRIWVNKYEFVE